MQYLCLMDNALERFYVQFLNAFLQAWSMRVRVRVSDSESRCVCVHLCITAHTNIKLSTKGNFPWILRG